MKFYSFSTQEEQRIFGGSCFKEMQFYKLKASMETKQIVSVSSINHWQNDSLYIRDDDMNQFYDEYSSIFDCWIYNNLKNGKFDTCDINYYRQTLLNPLFQRFIIVNI